MGLDFTALNSIPNTGNATTGQNTSQSGDAGDRPTKLLEQEKAERESTRQVYITYQENIKKAGILKTDIAKGIQRGEDPLELLLKALECISLMAGDTVLYRQGKENLIAVYGWGLKQPAPLKRELEEARQRLALLSRPELTTEQIPQGVQDNIQRAIRAHRELISTLERETAKGEADK